MIPLKIKNVLLSWIGFVVVYRIVIIIALVVCGVLDMYHFTYWNYLISWLFYVLLFSAMFAEGNYLKYLTLIGFPLVGGSILLVFTLIIVLIDVNEWLFLEGTEAGGGDVPVGRTHTGDIIVHTLPVIELLGLLAFGYMSTIQKYVLPVIKKNDAGSVGYGIYWYLASMLFVGFYAIFNDPKKVYPCDISMPAGVGLSILIVAFWMTWMFLIAISTTADKDEDVDKDKDKDKNKIAYPEYTEINEFKLL